MALMTRLTAAQARELLATKPKPRKYRNRPTVGADGRTYASKLEARHAEALDAQKRAGLIRGYLPQVSFSLPGTSRRVIIDFLVVMPDGRFRLEDAKGIETPAWRLKRDLLERALGVPVDLIRRTR
jgi:hypothetical protein